MGLLRLPPFGEAIHTDGHDNRSRRRLVFPVHGVGAAGQVTIRRQLKASSVPEKLPPCLIGIEARHLARGGLGSAT